MLSIRLINTLLLAAVCFTPTSVSSVETTVTCGDLYNVHRLSCDIGVIQVQTALYGRRNRVTCSEGKSSRAVANTRCSMRGATERIRKRCNGKKVCEMNVWEARTYDPCRGIYKYLETKYTCLPAIHHIACESSLAHLYCDVGQVIFVYGAHYGREDKTICAYRRPRSQIRNVHCSKPVKKVAKLCNGKNNCKIKVSNSEFGNLCRGVYKYLEVSYICEYPAN